MVLRSALGSKTTLSLSQESVDTEYVREAPEVVENLLRMISGKEINPDRFITLGFLQERLLAAEKWDMRGPLSIMRILLATNQEFSSSDPMRVYWLGSHFGWKDVTSAASKHSCGNDLFRANNQSLLGQMDATDLLRFIKFHKDRKDHMREHLFDDVAIFHATASDQCSGMVLNVEYQAFASKVLEEMDHTPPARKISGDRLRLFAEEAQLNECRCRSCGCHLPLCSRQDIIKQVKVCWSGLRQTLKN